MRSLVSCFVVAVQEPSTSPLQLGELMRSVLSPKVSPASLGGKWQPSFTLVTITDTKGDFWLLTLPERSTGQQ